MRRTKAASITALIGASVLLVTACSAGTGTTTTAATGGSSSAAVDSGPADTVFKVAFNQPETHPQFVALKAMGESLKAATDGRYGLDVYPNETLGAQKDTIELVQAGTIDMAVVAGPLLENFNPDFVVFDLPYAFESQAQQLATTNDPKIVSDLYSSLDDQSIHVLGAFTGGVRNVYNSKKPINTPADLGGMKIRVIQSDTNIEMMKLMGGTGTPMGQGDVYTAIQSGVLDGAENNELIYSSLKHDEIAGFYSYTRHLMIPDYLIINPALLDKMTKEDRAAIQTTLTAAIAQEGDLWSTQADDAKKTAEAAGAKFNEVDAAAFAKALAPLNASKLTNDVTRGISDKVHAAAK